MWDELGKFRLEGRNNNQLVPSEVLHEIKALLSTAILIYTDCLILKIDEMSNIEVVHVKESEE